VSEDCVGVRAASAASEQSARQEQDGLENDERLQNRDAHGRPLYKQSRILCGETGLHVLGSWLDPGRIRLSRNRQAPGLDGEGSCKDGYRLDDIAGQSRTAIDYDLQGLADMVNGGGAQACARRTWRRVAASWDRRWPWQRRIRV
jgi:hypothetical protein